MSRDLTCKETMPKDDDRGSRYAPPRFQMGLPIGGMSGIAGSSGLSSIPASAATAVANLAQSTSSTTLQAPLTPGNKFQLPKPAVGRPVYSSGMVANLQAAGLVGPPMPSTGKPQNSATSIPSNLAASYSGSTPTFNSVYERVRTPLPATSSQPSKSTYKASDSHSSVMEPSMAGAAAAVALARESEDIKMHDINTEKMRNELQNFEQALFNERLAGVLRQHAAAASQAQHTAAASQLLGIPRPTPQVAGPGSLSPVLGSGTSPHSPYGASTPASTSVAVPTPAPTPQPPRPTPVATPSSLPASLSNVIHHPTAIHAGGNSASQSRMDFRHIFEPTATVRSVARANVGFPAEPAVKQIMRGGGQITAPFLPGGRHRQQPPAQPEQPAAQPKHQSQQLQQELQRQQQQQQMQQQQRQQQMQQWQQLSQETCNLSAKDWAISECRRKARDAIKASEPVRPVARPATAAPVETLTPQQQQLLRSVHQRSGHHTPTPSSAEFFGQNNVHGMPDMSQSNDSLARLTPFSTQQPVSAAAAASSIFAQHSALQQALQQKLSSDLQRQSEDLQRLQQLQKQQAEEAQRLQQAHQLEQARLHMHNAPLTQQAQHTLPPMMSASRINFSAAAQSIVRQAQQQQEQEHAQPPASLAQPMRPQSQLPPGMHPAAALLSQMQNLPAHLMNTLGLSSSTFARLNAQSILQQHQQQMQQPSASMQPQPATQLNNSSPGPGTPNATLATPSPRPSILRKRTADPSSDHSSEPSTSFTVKHGESSEHKSAAKRRLGFDEQPGISNIPQSTTPGGTVQANDINLSGIKRNRPASLDREIKTEPGVGVQSQQLLPNGHCMLPNAQREETPRKRMRKQQFDANQAPDQIRMEISVPINPNAPMPVVTGPHGFYFQPEMKKKRGRPSAHSKQDKDNYSVKIASIVVDVDQKPGASPIHSLVSPPGPAFPGGMPHKSVSPKKPMPFKRSELMHEDGSNRTRPIIMAERKMKPPSPAKQGTPKVKRNKANSSSHHNIDQKMAENLLRAATVGLSHLAPPTPAPTFTSKAALKQMVIPPDSAPESSTSPSKLLTNRNQPDTARQLSETASSNGNEKGSEKEEAKNKKTSSASTGSRKTTGTMKNKRGSRRKEKKQTDASDRATKLRREPFEMNPSVQPSSSFFENAAVQEVLLKYLMQIPPSTSSAGNDGELENTFHHPIGFTADPETTLNVLASRRAFLDGEGGHSVVSAVQQVQQKKRLKKALRTRKLELKDIRKMKVTRLRRSELLEQIEAEENDDSPIPLENGVKVFKSIVTVYGMKFVVLGKKKKLVPLMTIEKKVRYQQRLARHFSQMKNSCSGLRRWRRKGVTRRATRRKQIELAALDLAIDHWPRKSASYQRSVEEKTKENEVIGFLSRSLAINAHEAALEREIVKIESKCKAKTFKDKSVDERLRSPVMFFHRHPNQRSILGDFNIDYNPRNSFINQRQGEQGSAELEKTEAYRQFYDQLLVERRERCDDYVEHILTSRSVQAAGLDDEQIAQFQQFVFDTYNDRKRRLLMELHRRLHHRNGVFREKEVSSSNVEAEEQMQNSRRSENRKEQGARYIAMISKAAKRWEEEMMTRRKEKREQLRMKKKLMREAQLLRQKAAELKAARAAGIKVSADPDSIVKAEALARAKAKENQPAEEPVKKKKKKRRKPLCPGIKLEPVDDCEEPAQTPERVLTAPARQSNLPGTSSDGLSSESSLSNGTAPGKRKKERGGGQKSNKPSINDSNDQESLERLRDRLHIQSIGVAPLTEKQKDVMKESMQRQRWQLAGIRSPRGFANPIFRDETRPPQGFVNIARWLSRREGRHFLVEKEKRRLRQAIELKRRSRMARGPSPGSGQDYTEEKRRSRRLNATPSMANGHAKTGMKNEGHLDELQSGIIPSNTTPASLILPEQSPTPSPPRGTTELISTTDVSGIDALEGGVDIDLSRKLQHERPITLAQRKQMFQLEEAARKKELEISAAEREEARKVEMERLNSEWDMKAKNILVQKILNECKPECIPGLLPVLAAELQTSTDRLQALLDDCKREYPSLSGRKKGTQSYARFSSIFKLGGNLVLDEIGTQTDRKKKVCYSTETVVEDLVDSMCAFVAAHVDSNTVLAATRMPTQPGASRVPIVVFQPDKIKLKTDGLAQTQQTDSVLPALRTGEPFPRQPPLSIRCLEARLAKASKSFRLSLDRIFRLQRPSSGPSLNERVAEQPDCRLVRQLVHRNLKLRPSGKTQRQLIPVLVVRRLPITSGNEEENDGGIDDQECDSYSDRIVKVFRPLAGRHRRVLLKQLSCVQWLRRQLSYRPVPSAEYRDAFDDFAKNPRQNGKPTLVFACSKDVMQKEQKRLYTINDFLEARRRHSARAESSQPVGTDQDVIESFSRIRARELHCTELTFQEVLRKAVERPLTCAADDDSDELLKGNKMEEETRIIRLLKNKAQEEVIQQMKKRQKARSRAEKLAAHFLAVKEHRRKKQQLLSKIKSGNEPKRRASEDTSLRGKRKIKRSLCKKIKLEATDGGYPYEANALDSTPSESCSIKNGDDCVHPSDRALELCEPAPLTLMESSVQEKGRSDVLGRSAEEWNEHYALASAAARLLKEEGLAEERERLLAKHVRALRTKQREPSLLVLYRRTCREYTEAVDNERRLLENYVDLVRAIDAQEYADILQMMNFDTDDDDSEESSREKRYERLRAVILSTPGEPLPNSLPVWGDHCDSLTIQPSTDYVNRVLGPLSPFHRGPPGRQFGGKFINRRGALVHPRGEDFVPLPDDEDPVSRKDIWNLVHFAEHDLLLQHYVLRIDISDELNYQFYNSERKRLHDSYERIAANGLVKLEGEETSATPFNPQKIEVSELDKRRRKNPRLKEKLEMEMRRLRELFAAALLPMHATTRLLRATNQKLYDRLFRRQDNAENTDEEPKKAKRRMRKAQLIPQSNGIQTSSSNSAIVTRRSLDRSEMTSPVNTPLNSSNNGRKLPLARKNMSVNGSTWTKRVPSIGKDRTAKLNGRRDVPEYYDEEEQLRLAIEESLKDLPSTSKGIY